MRRPPRTTTVLLVLAVLLAAAGSLAGAAAAQDASVSLVGGDDGLTLDPVENATVEGESELDAGTELTVRIRSVGDAETAFVRQATATVEDDGTFAASVDLSDAAAGDRFEVTVRHDGDTVASADGELAGGSDATTTGSESDSETESGDASGATVPGFGFGAALTAGTLLSAAAALRRR